MKNLFKIVVLLISLCPVLEGFTFSLSGDKIFREDFIKKYLSQTESSENQPDRLKAFLQAEAGRLGYFDADIETSFTSDSNIAVNLISGEKYHIHEIRLVNSDHIPQETADYLNDKFNNTGATDENIRSVLKTSVDYYINRGYPFAQSQIVSLGKTRPDILVIGLRIISGPMVKIDSLEFTSDKRISSSFLRRKAGLDTGLLFNQEIIDNSIERLNTLEYIRVDSFPGETYFNNMNSCLLSYCLRKAAQNRIEGALGYNPATAARDAYLFGYLDLAVNNPLGDGKCFYVSWDKPGETSSSLSIAMTWPYPLGSLFEARPSLSQEKYEDLYLSISADFDLVVEFSPGSSLNGGAGWTKITAQGESFSSIYNSRIYRAWLGLEYSSLKAGRIVFEGQSLALNVSYLHKRLYGTFGQEPDANSIDPIKADIEAKYGMRLSSGIFFEAGLNFEGYSGNEDLISAAEMIRLGGRKTLRGYSEEQFLTPRALWLNNEAGIVRGNFFKGYLFSDLGYARLTNIHSDDGIPESENKFLFGAGLGLGLFSERTGLDLSLGWSRDNSFGEGKLYLVLENRF